MKPEPGAASVVPLLVEAGLTVATAESLTGGLVAAALTSVPGASTVVRGGVVAYATDVKASVVGVDTDLLAREGAVSAETAAQLADRVRGVLGADVGVATTGVAGPEPAEGHPVGTVFVAVAGPWGIDVERHALTGDREDVRAASVTKALDLLERGLCNLRDAVGAGGYGKNEHQSTHDAGTTENREEAP